MGGEIGIHPGHGIALFDVEGSCRRESGFRIELRILRHHGGSYGAGFLIGPGFGAVLVVLEDHFTEDAVDLHHFLNTLDRYIPTLYIDLIAVLLLIDLESRVDVNRGGNPYLVAVQVAHHAHVGVVGQRVLGDKVDIGADFRRVDHIGRNEPARIGSPPSMEITNKLAIGTSS